MQDDKLAYMANQIAAFFQSRPHEEAVAGVANHINKFWEPRMRAQLLASIEAGSASLKPIVIEAAPHIRKPKS
jgi:formate dehydrogenase subunit delta